MTKTKDLLGRLKSRPFKALFNPSFSAPVGKSFFPEFALQPKKIADRARER